MWDTWVQSLNWEDPLEKGKATHSSILAWRIPWTVQSMGSQRVRHDWANFTSHTHINLLLCKQITTLFHQGLFIHPQIVIAPLRMLTYWKCSLIISTTPQWVPPILPPDHRCSLSSRHLVTPSILSSNISLSLTKCSHEQHPAIQNLCHMLNPEAFKAIKHWDVRAGLESTKILRAWVPK